MTALLVSSSFITFCIFFVSHQVVASCPNFSFRYSLTVTYLICSVSAARILGIFPKDAKSHFQTNKAILKSLQEAGHQITMITAFPLEAQMENFTSIDASFNSSFVFMGKTTIQWADQLDLSSILNLQFEVEERNCYNVMGLPIIQELMNSPEKSYDVMFVELLKMYECFLPLAEKLGIPVIGTVTFHSWRIADHSVGFPNNPAVIPFELYTSKVKMNFFERAQNLWYYLAIELYLKPKIRKSIEKFYEQHFTAELLHKKKISMAFYNNHASLLPRAAPPNAIDVGGIHLTPAKPLPEDLQEFIDEAPSGVILFSLGSVIKASSMSVSQRDAFVEAFKLIPQRVIWKFDGLIENLSENIMVLNWLPQRDILEHDRVVAFISHCGQGGVYEAMMTGTPVVTVPIYADQPANAALLQYRGVAVNLDLKTITKEKVLAALDTIVNDTSYYKRMQELSRTFKDRPMTPQEQVVYWTEYVIRNNGSLHLEILGTDMPFYQYLMLDVIFIVIIFSGFLIYHILKEIYFLFHRKRKCTPSSKKYK